MAAPKLNLLLFGDQTFDIEQTLVSLLRQRDNVVLESFLANAYEAIRREIHFLPHHVRDAIPRLTCIDDLVMLKGSHGQCVALDMAVLTLFQLGTFIMQASPTYADEHKSQALGLCTGSLAAAAVSCSQNPLDLVPLATAAVKIAFRTGLLVTDAARRIEPASAASRSWALIVPKLDAKSYATEFRSQCEGPKTSQPYISAHAPSGLTVSGPPAGLARFKESLSHAGYRYRDISIYGPYHAAHLYSAADVNDILSGLLSEPSLSRPQTIPLLTSSGTTLQRKTFAQLLQSAVEHILLEPIAWSTVLQNLQHWLTDADPEKFSVWPIGTTADQLILTSLNHSSIGKPFQREQQESAVEPPSSLSRPSAKSKIAIVGTSGRYPGAQDNAAFWDLLAEGLDMHKPVPPLHWDAATHVDPTGKRKNTSSTPFGCWLDQPQLFDARFFNISPREAPQIDPAQRIALMTAYEALEQAGIVPDATPSTRLDRVGVFYGVTSNDWMETNSAQEIDFGFIPGGNRAFIPGRINYCFKFSGPSYAVDTACSSSLAGIHLACNSLWKGDIDTAIAGGTNVLTNPDFTAGLDRGHFLSRTGNCKTFDDEADGYCRGEGVATIILKRLEDAVADKDPILGLILGANTNHSAESESITRPHSGAQRAIFTKILNQAGVDPYSVSYVEMHGTGTQAGDASEMASVLETFAPPMPEVKTLRRASEALYLGSAKANIGHGEAASGVSSLIKVLMMMHKNTIVPHCGIKKTINRKFPTDLEDRNVFITRRSKVWERGSDPRKPRRAFVNNFSAAGGNTAVLIEEAPRTDDSILSAADPRGRHLVAVSAKVGLSAHGNLRSLLDFVSQNREISLSHLSYTSTARRLHHQHRVMFCVSTISELCTQLEAAINEEAGKVRPKPFGKSIFVFTGQGAQYPGMGKQLFESFSLFRNEMQRLDFISQGLGFPSMLPLVESMEQDIGVFSPVQVQLANICMQIALTKLWASWNIRPSAVMGHSLGEYAALNIAGVLSDADCLFLVGKRAELLMQHCHPDEYSMLVVKGALDQIRPLLSGDLVEVACINSPIETVFSGPNSSIAELQAVLASNGLKSSLLKVPYAFHSSQMEPILEPFKRLAATVSYAPPKIAVISPLGGDIITAHDVFGPEYLAKHTRQPVNTLSALHCASETGVISSTTPVIEVGPHPAISSMIRAVLGNQISCIASAQRSRDMWQVIGAALKTLYVAGADIRWSEYHRDFACSHKVLSLPAYSWDLKEYWIQYVNDWSLRKGDPLPQVTQAAKLQSTTIHRVVEESSTGSRTRLVVEADIARHDLSPLVQGHEVDGIPLCTPSVYADIAFTLGHHALQAYRPLQKERAVDVTDMIISKALILKAGVAEQLLQTHTEADWEAQTLDMKFMSFDSKGKLQEHARCTIRYRDSKVKEELQRNLKVTKDKISKLRQGVAEGATARFNRPMAYRAIRPLARFHDDYRAIDEVVLNSDTLEAASVLSYGSVKREGTFHTHPAIIDSLTQSCGFTMNCNDYSDLDTEVFMNHGWGSFQLFQPIDYAKNYTTYTQMKEGADKLWYGDVVVLDGDEVVAHLGSIAIQGVPRRVLQVILSLESGGKPGKAAATAKSGPREVRPAQAAASAVPLPAPSESNGAHARATTALKIIAEESGLLVSDFTDDTSFADVGVDSLLGLTISARFKEELEEEVDFNAFFYEYPTVRALRAFLDSSATVDAPSTTTASSASADSRSESTEASSVASDEHAGAGVTVEIAKALQIVAEESGLGLDHLTDDTSFADSGVDSLLSLVIVSRLRDELGIDVQHESLFLECPTVLDLKKMLGLPPKVDAAAPSVSSSPLLEDPPVNAPADAVGPSPADAASLRQRKDAVDAYLERYGSAFQAPSSASTARMPSRHEKVVLVTGATGSLGGHLVYHLAQLADVKQIICLNRMSRSEPRQRQNKAMRDKGIRFPDDLQDKLLVHQTDTAMPRLGLSEIDYQQLVQSTTHLIHNAWPMSAKRPLSGFESQFQVMRNLIDFAQAAASQRPAAFQFSFQMVSSVGVVGHYGLGNGQQRTTVPEERVDIDSVLPNGYGEAKWGCERMLDQTLHRHPERFRTMVVRLGQIAGSKTSGYWNPMEHFGFLIKSSQTLKALPEVGGQVFWTPVNDIAATLAELVLGEMRPHAVYHIENPVGQSWSAMNGVLAEALQIRERIPFEEWVRRVRAGPTKDNPASMLLDFLDHNYLRMSCGGLVLGVRHTLEHSATLGAVGPVSDAVVRRYIHIWREIGFLTA